MRRVLAFLVLASLCSCAGGSEVSGDRRVVGAVTMTFTVRPARVEAGLPVRLAIRLNNVSGRKTELSFPTGQMYEFTVTRGRRIVWRYSDGKTYSLAPTTKSIEPLGFLTFSESWTPGREGVYAVHGELLARGYGHELDGRLQVGG